MALSKPMKISAAVIVGVVFILAVGLGVGLSSGQKQTARQTKEGIWLEFAPQPPKGDKLISVKNNNSQEWTSILDKFLSEYNVTKITNDEARAGIVTCGFDNPPPPGKYCAVDLKAFEPCVAERGYDYKRSSPCVFLALNKVLNWTPEPYNTTESLPQDMPTDLKNYISPLDAKQKNKIWVSCEGENATDTQRMGNIQFLPYRGFPTYFYPDTGLQGYLRPLVALHFERPQSGVLINVKCVLWAKNIPIDHSKELGTVHFELMVN